MDDGDADAQFTLGTLHEEGRYVLQSYEMAARWYRRAAAQGRLDAQLKLGSLYYEGRDFPRGSPLMLEWRRRAAVQGRAEAAFNLTAVFGSLYAKSQGFPRDYKKALEGYLPAAEQGHAGAQYIAASMYYKGRGVPWDYPAALHWLRRAAEQGHDGARFDLALMYAKGQGFPRNYEEARNAWLWLRESAGSPGRLAALSAAAAAWVGTIALPCAIYFFRRRKRAAADGAVSPARAALRAKRAAAARAAAALLFALFLTGLDRDLVRRGWLPIPEIAVFASCMASLAVLAAVGPGRSWAGLWRRAAALLRLHRTFAAAFAAPAALSLTYWLVHPNADLRSVLTIVTAFCTCAAGALPAMFPLVRRHWRAFLGTALAIYCLTVWADIGLPGTFSNTETRAAGAAMDANAGAYMLTLFAAVLLPRRIPSIAGLLLLLLVGLSGLPTLSRSGLLVYAALCGGYFLLALAHSRGRRRLVCLVSAAAAVMLIVSMRVSVQSLDFFSSGEAEYRLDLLSGREDWLRNRADTRQIGMLEDLAARNDRLRPRSAQQAAAQSGERPAAQRQADGGFVYLPAPRVVRLQNAWEAIAASPIRGHGTRFSLRQDIQPHNMYLAMWIDFGILGFLLYVAFLAAGFRSFYKLRCLPGMFLMGTVACWSLFMHTVFDYRPLFMLLGLLTALASPLENGGNERKQAAAP